MNLKEMLAELKRTTRITGLKPSDIRIGSGSAMMFYGLRESTGDVDAAVSSDLFKVLLNDKRFEVIEFKSIITNTTRSLVRIGKVDFHNEDDMPDLRGPTKDFNGYRVDIPATILKMKQMLGRPKDQADIRLLMDYIE